MNSTMPEAEQAAYHAALDKLYGALPRVMPWFNPVMHVQFGLSVFATILALVPVVLLAIKRRGRIAGLLMPFTVAHEVGVNQPYIIPIPITICLLMVFVMSVGSLVSGRLLTAFFNDPLGTQGEGGLACLFIVWFLAAVGMCLACFGCAVSAILSPASRSSYRTFVRMHPTLTNLFCLAFPFVYGTIGIVVSSLVQHRLDVLRSSGRKLERILLSGLSGSDRTAILNAQLAAPSVIQASHQFESLNKAATWMNASMTCLMILVCTPCLVHILVLSRTALRESCTRLDGQITQINRLSQALEKGAISVPSSPMMSSHKLSPPSSPFPEISQENRVKPPARHVQLLNREKTRIKWRHVTVLAQWLIGLTCLVHLGVMALYLAVKYEDIKTSNEIVQVSLASASIFSPAYNALMSIMTIIRMVFLEDPDKTLVASGTQLAATKSTAIVLSAHEKGQSMSDDGMFEMITPDLLEQGHNSAVQLIPVILAKPNSPDLGVPTVFLHPAPSSRLPIDSPRL